MLLESAGERNTGQSSVGSGRVWFAWTANDGGPRTDLCAGKVPWIQKVDFGAAVVKGMDKLVRHDVGHVIRVVDVVLTQVYLRGVRGLRKRRCNDRAKSPQDISFPPLLTSWA